MLGIIKQNVKYFCGRVLKYAAGCFEVLLCRSFMIKRTAQ